MFRKSFGFTIVELMMVMGIFGILASVTITIYFQLVQASNRAAIAAEVEQTASFLMEMMVRDIREADCVGGSGDLLLLKDVNCNEPELIRFEKVCPVPPCPVPPCPVPPAVCYLTKNGSFLNSDNVTVTSLEFSEPLDSSTRKVTVDLTMESTKPAAHTAFKGQLSLHETIGLRKY